MKKIVAVLGTIMIMLSMVGCGLAKPTDPAELKKNSGTMFEGKYVYGGIVEENYLSTIDYKVKYDGTVEMTKEYILLGAPCEFYATATLTDSELTAIYDASKASLKKNDFENYMIDGWDGGIWTFTFYEAGSTSGEDLFHGSFSGGNNALDTFRNILEHYSNTVDFYNADGDAEPALN